MGIQAKTKETDMALLSERIKEYALKEGVDKIGFAPIERLLEYGLPEGRRPQDILPGAKSIITFSIAGIDIPRHAIVDPETKVSRGATEWTNLFVLLGSGWPGSALVDLLAYRVARFIIGHGYRAIPIPAGHPYDNVNHRGIISHKHAAVECGLGEQGLHTLLITPEYGSNGYLASIITDAELVHDERFKAHLCESERGNCKLACIKACPVGALSKDGIDKDKCSTFQRGELGTNYGYPSRIYLIRCGVCMGSCPIGRQI